MARGTAAVRGVRREEMSCGVRKCNGIDLQYRRRGGYPDLVRHRRDHTLEVFAINVLRHIELDVAAIRFVVAREAIGADRKRQRRKPRIVRIVGKTVDAAWQLLGELAGEKQILGVVGIFEPEQDTA